MQHDDLVKYFCEGKTTRQNILAQWRSTKLPCTKLDMVQSVKSIMYKMCNHHSLQFASVQKMEDWISSLKYRYAINKTEECSPPVQIGLNNQGGFSWDILIKSVIGRARLNTRIIICDLEQSDWCVWYKHYPKRVDTTLPKKLRPGRHCWTNNAVFYNHRMISAK